MRHGPDQQRQESYADHDQRKLPRPDQIMPLDRAFQFKLEKFVNAEAETDERRGCPDPRHQRSIKSDARPIESQLCAHVQRHRATSVASFLDSTFTAVDS